MKRVVHKIHKAGNINDLKLAEEELPDPAENEVTIEVKAVGLNFADVFALTGLYSATPKGSFIPGLEFSGIVHKTGKNVRNFKLGDSIMAVTRFGGYANYINIDSDYITHLPKKWSFEEGAAYVVQALTAYYALFPLGNLKKDQTVLIHSAAGGVGILANRIAKKWNSFTIGSIGNPNKLDLLKKEGYDVGIVRGSDFKKKLTEALDGRELDLVLECIGGNIFQISYDALCKGGRLVAYGAAEFTPSSSSPDYLKLGWLYLTRPRIDPLEMMTHNKSVMAFNLIWIYEKKKELKPMLDELMRIELEPPLIGKVFEFENALEAVHFFRSGNSVGKVVLKI